MYPLVRSFFLCEVVLLYSPTDMVLGSSDSLSVGV